MLLLEALLQSQASSRMNNTTTMVNNFALDTQAAAAGLSLLHMFEGIYREKESSPSAIGFPDDVENKLAALEQLDREHKPWQHGFQQLLNFPLSMDDESLLLQMTATEQQQFPAPAAAMAAHGDLTVFEPESCVTHVSESCSPAKTEPQNHCNSAEHYQCYCNSASSSDAPEEGVSSRAVPEPAPVNSATTALPGKQAEPPRERRKRKRARACKNSEEVESQRMTHIAVERNRRKQMNEHLSVLRSLMPGSYIQRGDQASIIGGAIDYVKELEQLLQSLQAQKRKRECEEHGISPDSAPLPFNCFFTSPQYTSYSNGLQQQPRLSSNGGHDSGGRKSGSSEDSASEAMAAAAENKSAVADIEVSMIETHANIKILSHKRAGQLLRTIAALQSLHLTILHLNVTSVDHTVLYSFNVKIEEDCQMTSADEIAAAVNRILDVIHSSRPHQQQQQ